MIINYSQTFAATTAPAAMEDFHLFPQGRSPPSFLLSCQPMYISFSFIAEFILLLPPSSRQILTVLLKTSQEGNWTG